MHFSPFSCAIGITAWSVYANAASVVTAVSAIVTEMPRAIVPTASGQIGVNPVSIYSTLTAYQTTDSVPAVTISSSGATKTASAPFAVVTEANGDLVFPAAPDSKNALQSLFDEVTAACVGKTKRDALQKRSGQCELDYLSRPNVGGGLLEFDFPGIAIPTFTAGDVSVALTNTPAAVAVAFIAYVIGDGKVSDDSAAKVPASNVLTKTPTVTSSSKAADTTSLDDILDSLYTADDSVYASISSAVVARIAGDASGDLFENSTTPVTVPNPECDQKDIQNMETSIFKKIVSSFCTDADLGKSKSGDLTNKDADTTSFADYTWHMQWDAKDGGDCGSLKCEDIFNKFASSCAYDSHSMWPSGSVSVDCGKASYEIRPPAKETTSSSAPPPAPTAELNKPDCYNSPPLKPDDMAGKINEFCKDAVDGGWHWEQKDTVSPDEVANNGLYSGIASHTYSDVKTEDGSQILALMIAVNQASCPAGAEYKVDFKAMGVDGCTSNFNVAINGCAPFEKPDNTDYWKKGGMNRNDCIQWTVSTAPT